MTHSINETHRQAARMAGWALLLGMAIAVVTNYVIYPFRLTVPGDAVQTARNLLAHERSFRIATACNLVYVVNELCLISALYVLLKPVDRSLALVAALSRLVFALMWGLSALNGLGALRLLGDAAYLGVFRADQLQVLARLHLGGNFDVYYVGLPFWALASTVCFHLWLKSKCVPMGLAVLGLASSAWGVFCAFAFLVFPTFKLAVDPTWFDLPMAIFEMVLGLWILIKGLRPSGMAEAELP